MAPELPVELPDDDEPDRLVPEDEPVLDAADADMLLPLVSEVDEDVTEDDEDSDDDDEDVPDDNEDVDEDDDEVPEA